MSESLAASLVQAAAKGTVLHGCRICGDPTHSTERHEETLDDDF